MRILRELGYVENQNFDFVYRSSGGNQDRLPTLAEELVQLKPDVILAIAIAAAVPARKATSTKSRRTVAANAATTAVPTAHCRIACDRAQLYWGCDRPCGWALFAGIADAFEGGPS
jgi:hypothetical protein